MKKILYFGDSITDAGRNADRGSLISIGQGYPVITASRLSLDHPGELEFDNRGISGHRVVDLYARIKVDCWNTNPDVLSVLIGINDVWHDVNEHNGVEADRFENIYNIMLRETKERFPDIKIIVMEPFILHGWATDEKWEQFRAEADLRAAAAKRVAEANDAYFLPLQKDFDEALKIMPAGYWIGDGVHPTIAGHQLIADKWLKLFEEKIYPSLNA